MASKIALLDVNILIALFDIEHQYHDIVGKWLLNWKNQGNRWASCPITQNGCLRILSTPKYANCLGLKTIKQNLTFATSSPLHTFIPDNISLLQDELINWQSIQGAKQLTDAYLLALAKYNQVVFVSLDNRIDIKMAFGVDDNHFISLLS